MTKLLFRSVVGLLFATFSIGVSQAATTESSRDIDVIEQKAAAGDPDSQFDLGMAYLFGEHDHTYSGKQLPKNASEALHWLTLSANQGNSQAQYNIGQIYLDGEDIPRNPFLAQSWLEKSARQGNQQAALSLADMYAFGEGIPQDKKKAMDFYSLGYHGFELSMAQLQFMAEQKDTEAQLELSGRYVAGWHDVPKDEQLSRYWEREAANNNDVRAQFLLGFSLVSDHQYDEAKLWLEKAKANGIKDTKDIDDLLARIAEEQSKSN